MERGTIVHFCQFHELIISGERFVRFKLPGTKTYQILDYRLRVGDCSGERLNARK